MLQIIAVIMLLAGAASVQAQRLISRQWGVGIKYGMPLPFEKNSDNMEIGLHQYLKSANYLSYSIAYEKTFYRTDIKDIPIETYFAEIGFHKSLITNRSKSLLFYGGISAIGGYKIYNNGVNVLDDNSVITEHSKFVFGGALAGSLETFISDQWIIAVSGKLRALSNTEDVTLTSLLQLGIRYNF